MGLIPNLMGLRPIYAMPGHYMIIETALAEAVADGWGIVRMSTAIQVAVGRQ